MINAHLHLALMRRPSPRPHPHPRLHPHPRQDHLDGTIAPSRAPVTVRLAAPDDALELRRIAELDSAELPAGALLIGERAGRPVAVLSLSDGAVVANPFVHTADVIGLLRLRARQLGPGDGRGRRRRAIAWRLLRAAG